ncbi:MAG: Small-conductance mechanosensitive channel [Rhodobacteraceae bacterium HLUCCO07]|nr:MAG: Small-conductance mechanosensitive channel [Rhodobacteraceae bacterium HLUCCO07]
MNKVRAFLLSLMLCLLALPGVAQQTDEQAIDYDAWQRIAERAETAVEAGRASDAALGSLRMELAEWRARFLDAQSTNNARIRTTREQLSALGSPPENGEEPTEIAQSRSELNAQLAELQAPVKTAEIAHARADGLIRGIDAIIRDRQSQQLLERGPLPVNPLHWAPALSELNTAFANLRNEWRSAWENPIQREMTKSRLPMSILLLIAGTVLLVQGWKWVSRLTVRIQNHSDSRSRWLLGFVASLGQPLVMLLGFTALIEAAYSTGLPGLRGEQLLSALRPAGYLFIVSMWIALRVFPRGNLDDPPLKLSAERRREGRFEGGLIGLVLGLSMLVRPISTYEGWTPATNAVVTFPLIVLSGLLMWRLARLLRQNHARIAEDDAATPGYIDQLLLLLARALQAVAIAGVLLALGGYFEAARTLTFSMLSSVLLLAFVMILQRLVAELWVLFSGFGEEGRDGLVPVLAGFVLSLAAAPFLAMIWGARSTELIELWTQVNSGFMLGETRISPVDFLTFAIVFAAGYTITRLLQGTLRNTVLPKTRMDVGGQNALVSGLGYVGIFLAAIIAITSAGIDLSSLAIVAGALSVGIGFGLQNIVSNFVSGIILLIERPISEGDWIEVGGQMGYVRDISVRSTRIETFDRTDVIVPNADLVSGTVTNYTRGNTVGRVIVPVGVAYGTDTGKVEAILREIAEAHPMVLLNPPPAVVFQGFGASSLDFEIRAILRDVNWVLTVKSDMNHEIAKRFADEGIEIPFAQRDVWLRNPEVLGGGPERPAEPSHDPAPDDRKPGRRADRPDLSNLHESDMDDGDPGVGGDGDGDGR